MTSTSPSSSRTLAIARATNRSVLKHGTTTDVTTPTTRRVPPGLVTLPGCPGGPGATLPGGQPVAGDASVTLSPFENSAIQ